MSKRPVAVNAWNSTVCWYEVPWWMLTSTRAGDNGKVGGSYAYIIPQVGHASDPRPFATTAPWACVPFTAVVAAT